uniref:Uncharacterized protein n=1 Tax=Kwoniella bestiolae CBS 10118 TaxID=1296100 RepID=A0A1B9G4M1_9TREE|nr:hypothetical protein I302_03666 [Kwoniella bestiolae CBS 10118]OCF25989.1 hypothetical protein I302_03666 [Kwoniella bestiolae CBS 10118]
MARRPTFRRETPVPQDEKLNQCNLLAWKYSSLFFVLKGSVAFNAHSVFRSVCGSFDTELYLLAKAKPSGIIIVPGEVTAMYDVPSRVVCSEVAEPEATSALRGM